MIIAIALFSMTNIALNNNSNMRKWLIIYQWICKHEYRPATAAAPARSEKHASFHLLYYASDSAPEGQG